MTDTTAPTPTVTIVCDAAHLTTTTGSQVYNLHRLRRAVGLLRDKHPDSVVNVLLREFPTMGRSNAVYTVLAAQQIIAHDLEI